MCDRETHAEAAAGDVVDLLGVDMERVVYPGGGSSDI